MRILFTTALLLSSLPLAARDHVARIVKPEAKAEVFVPLAGKEGPGGRLVNYLDRTFRIVAAERGMKRENGAVVNTGPAASSTTATTYTSPRTPSTSWPGSRSI